MKGPVAVDANLLLLLIVGSASPAYIAQHKRLRDVYTEDDLSKLVELLGEFSDIVLLPNTLTEASNLLRYIAEPARTAVLHQMRQLVRTGTEQFIPSATGVARAEFLALGLTDAVLLELSSVEVDDRPTLMTVDLDLAIAAEMRGYRVMNFNHYL